MVFIEGESLIFRIIDMRLQPRDVYVLCSLDDDCPRGEDTRPSQEQVRLGLKAREWPGMTEPLSVPLLSTGTGGWGFKSLFAVSDTPVIFSSPFQLRLDAASRGPHGVLCPEWVPSVDATNARGEAIIPPSYRARIKDNSTFVYAPLRESAKALLKAGDMERFDGLTLAFLDQLRKVDLMLVSYEGPAEVKVVRSLQHEVELVPAKLEEGFSATTASLQKAVRIVGHRAAECTIRLNKTVRVPDRNYEQRQDPVEQYYRLHEFQVSLGDKETTLISLAFPLDAEKKPMLKERRRKENNGNLHTESIYCRTPVPHAGSLPFALNADFDLTSDMLGLHPTSAWNHWVLSCAARLFVLSFLNDAKLRESNHRTRAHLVEVAEWWGVGTWTYLCLLVW